MAETLRDLVVSLSLNSDNFTRNIKSITRQIQEAQSEFRLASSGIQNFETTTTGLSTKLSTLQRIFQLQTEAVGQYERALDAARAKLQECYSREGDYANRLADAKQRQSEAAEQVQNATAVYENYKNTLGETDSATIAAAENLEAAKQDYAAVTEEVTKLEGQHAALTKATQNAADAVSQANVRLNNARTALQGTQTEINSTNQALVLSQNSWNTAAEAMENSRTAVASISRQMQTAESRFRLAAAGVNTLDGSADRLGGRLTLLSAKTTLLTEKVSLQQRAVEQHKIALEAAKQQLEAAKAANDPEKIRQATDAVEEAQAALNNAQAELIETTRELDAASSSWTSFGVVMNSISESAARVSETTGRIGRTLTTTLTTPIAALATTAVKSSIDFESAFTSVRKTVDASEAEFGVLSDSVKEMSTEIAAGTSEIAEVMATGGQLGIHTENLQEFTRVMIDLGNSCEDLDANEAATSLAKFANVMGTDQSLFSNIGSTVVDLGNNFATTEEPIMTMAQRLAGAGKQVGLTEAQILGFSAALSSVGITAEMGGSAFSKALIKMEVAAETGGEALEDFASVSGMSAEQFKALWDSDPASAFMAFIQGLAQMDDEGMSAIATLNEIGISEVRLRDTLLRSVNATDLFTEALAMADSAWEENTALSTEANKRYATTASKLTNLKNKAVLVAQTFGDDLNPTIRNVIDGVSSFIDKLASLDSAQRVQIVKIATIVAAIGPAFLAISKVAKITSTVTGAIGTFATAVGNAGGGFKGFMSVLNNSPAVCVAVAAGIAVGTAALIDYASGAKQARDALNGMEETANNWKNNNAETFYGTSEGLAAFGMSESDFTEDKENAQSWIDGVLAVWSDGQKDTDEIVAQWTDSFKALTGSTRTELQELKDTADESGYSSLSEQLAADIETLDSMDAEIEALLKKRQNGNLTDADKIRLQELIDAKEAIEIKYRLTAEDTNGFRSIRDKVQTEIAKAQARGEGDADVSVYQDAVKAAAEGLATVNAQIDSEYDKQYAAIQLIEDAQERQTAFEELNAQYIEQRKAAAQEYAETLASVIMPVWNQPEIQEAGEQVDQLYQKLRQYSTATESEKPAILEEINELTANMDEGALSEYYGMLTQIQSLLDSGMSTEEIRNLFPEIDVTSAMEQLAGIQTYLNEYGSTFSGLKSMFGEGLSEEVLTIATDLNMDGAQARWNEFAANPGAITTDAVIASYDDTGASKQLMPSAEATVTAYTEATEGADTSNLEPDDITAWVFKYLEDNGVDTTKLKPEDITAYVDAFAEATGCDKSTLMQNFTAKIAAYDDTGAIKPTLTVTIGITGYDLTAYRQFVAANPVEVEGIVKLGEVTDTPTEVLLDPNTKFWRDGVEIPVDAVPQEQLTSDTVAVLDSDGTMHILITPEVTGSKEAIEQSGSGLTEDKVISSIFGNYQSNNLGFLNDMWGSNVFDRMQALTDKLNMYTKNIKDTWLDWDIFDRIGKYNREIGGEISTEDTAALQSYVAEVVTAIRNGEEVSEEDLNHLQMIIDFINSLNSSGAGDSFIAGMAQNLNGAGITTSVETLAGDLQTSLDTAMQGVDGTETGKQVAAGIGEGMAGADMSGSAETTASNTESDLDTAYQINSPSRRMKPIGAYIAAGIGQGMTEYNFAGEAGTIAASMQSALRASFTAGAFYSIGRNAMAGWRNGITSGTSGVVSAIRLAARKAVQAAKRELVIKSPSHVFRDEVGAMMMKGIGVGIEQETDKQAKIIANAAHYLTGEAKEASIGYNTSYDQRRYDQSSSVSVSGNSFYINDQQDIRDLAVEISALTRRTQRGRGMRLA